MRRLPTLLTIGLLFALSCRRAGPSGEPPPAASQGVKARFHFQPGHKLRMSMKGDFDFKDRALGLDRDGLYTSGRLSFDVEIEIVRSGSSGFTGRLTPLSYDYASGEDELVYKDGKLARSAAAEKDGLELPMKPYDLRLADDGHIADVRPDQGPPGLMFVGPMLSQPASLLGWLGLLPDTEIRDRASWTSSTGVVIPNVESIPLKVVVKGIKKDADGWSVGMLLGVDKTSDNYPWLKTCVETGTGSLELNARGRPVRAAVSWEAKTADGQPIGEYQWTCEFSR